MSLQTKLERLAQRTREAATDQAEMEATLARQADRPTRAGDLFSPQETAEWPVQWLVVDAAGPPDEHHLLVPVDVSPFLGPDDLAVEEDATAGALSARCSFAVRVPRGLLEPALRTGTLSDRDVERIRARLARAEGVSTEVESEAGSEYAEWAREVLEPAWRAWPAHQFAASPSAAPPAVLRSNPVVVSLLAACLVLAVGLAWQTARLREAQLDAVAERPTRLPLAFLAPQRSQRGGSTALELPAEAPRFAVVLSLDPERLHSSYRVVLMKDGALRPVWSMEQLHREGAPWLNLEVPSRLLESGEYRFQVFDEDSSEEGPTSEYLLRIVREPLDGSQRPDEERSRRTQ